MEKNRHQAFIWTSAGLSKLDTQVEALVKFDSKTIFLYNKMTVKMSSAKWWPFCLDLNVLSDT